MADCLYNWSVTRISWINNVYSSNCRVAILTNKSIKVFTNDIISTAVWGNTKWEKIPKKSFWRTFFDPREWERYTQEFFLQMILFFGGLFGLVLFLAYLIDIGVLQ